MHIHAGKRNYSELVQLLSDTMTETHVAKKKKTNQKPTRLVGGEIIFTFI